MRNFLDDRIKLFIYHKCRMLDSEYMDLDDLAHGTPEVRVIRKDGHLFMLSLSHKNLDYHNKITLKELKK